MRRPGWEHASASTWRGSTRPDGSVVAFVDPDVVESTTRAQLTDVVQRHGNRIERADGPDGDEAMQTTLLYAVVDLDGTIAGPGYGVLGQLPHRCRPLSELVERAITDLTAVSDIDRR